MEKLLNIFKEVLNVSEKDFSDDLNFNNVYAWDSMAHMILVVQIEEQFNVSLDADEIASMTNVRDIRKILQDKNVL